MGNQSNLPQARRYQESPIICCGDEPRRQPFDEASPNVMNVDKNTYGRFSKAYTGSEKHEDHVNFEDTGSTYYKEKDVSIFRRPGNQLENSNFHNPRISNFDHENMSKDSKFLNPLRPITQQQSQLKKSGFSSFKKSTYGAYNSNNGHNAFNSYGMHTAKDTKEDSKLNLDSKNHKPTPMMDFVGQKDIRQQINNEKAKNQGHFVGDGKYGGRIEEFENNKRIIMFLEQNYVNDPKFKFYDTRDNSSLMNNSTVKLAKKKKETIENRYLDENSNANLRINENLSRLQEPIQLSFQIDARIILATGILIIAIVIFILGTSVFYSQTSFFVCLMIAIILYVCYVLVCYIYSDILQYFYNTRSFDQFEQDYKKLKEANGQIAYHVQLQTPKTLIKECYLLSKQNKYTKIQQVQNQNKDISINQLKDKQTSCVFIRYKTKTSFFDTQSQLNTINYFDDFLEQQRNIVQAHYGRNQQSKKTSKKSKGETQKEQKNSDQRQNQFKKALKKCDFGYQLDSIEGFSRKPQQVFNVCYMEEDDGGCMIVMFVIFTLLGLCLPFLCFFEAYTKRYRINLLNRFKIGEGGVPRK